MESSQQQQLLLGDSFSYRWLINVNSSADSLCDSFSYRWLINVNSSADSLGDSHRSVDSQDACSFIEIDPAFISMRWSTNPAAIDDDFDFNLPASTQCSVQVHADKIFSGGLLLPLHVRCPPETNEVNAHNAFDSGLSRSSLPISRATPASSSPLFHTARSSPPWMSSCPLNSRARRSRRLNLHLVRNCSKSPKKILCKFFCFLMPLYKMVKFFRVILISSKSVSSCKDSARISPRTSTALSSIEWCRSNADISIYDAILHCKKSIGQDK